jgi:hypothetical protein
MIKKKNNLIMIVVSFILSLLGGLIVFYIKSEEIDELKKKIKLLEQENNKLKINLNKYSEILNKI